jgi:hypothetical protein
MQLPLAQSVPAPQLAPSTAFDNTSMAETSAFSRTGVNLTAISPVALAIAEKDSMTAMWAPPAVLKMSKSVSTVTPLTATLNERCPDPLTLPISAKCRRSWCEELGANPRSLYANVPTRAVWYTAAGAGFDAEEVLMLAPVFSALPPVNSKSEWNGETAGPPQLTCRVVVGALTASWSSSLSPGGWQPARAAATTAIVMAQALTDFISSSSQVRG